MGQVGQGVGQIHLVRLQGLLLLPQPHRHLVNFTAQDAQFSLAVFLHPQVLLPVENAVEGLGELGQFPVGAGGVPLRQAPKAQAQGEKEQPLESAQVPPEPGGSPGEGQIQQPGDGLVLQGIHLISAL